MPPSSGPSGHLLPEGEGLAISFRICCAKPSSRLRTLEKEIWGQPQNWTQSRGCPRYPGVMTSRAAGSVTEIALPIELGNHRASDYASGSFDKCIGHGTRDIPTFDNRERRAFSKCHVLGCPLSHVQCTCQTTH